LKIVPEEPLPTRDFMSTNQQVSGTLGVYMEGLTKRHCCQQLFGNIASAIGERKLLVQFDDGTEKECPSAVLSTERVATSLPSDVQISIDSTYVDAMDAEDVQEEIADQDEEAELLDRLTRSRRGGSGSRGTSRRKRG
jgi:hypothetical protein